MYTAVLYVAATHLHGPDRDIPASHTGMMAQFIVDLPDLVSFLLVVVKVGTQLLMEDGGFPHKLLYAPRTRMADRWITEHGWYV